MLVGDQRWGLSELLIVDDDPQRTSKPLILGPHLRDSSYNDVLQRLIEGHGLHEVLPSNFSCISYDIHVILNGEVNAWESDILRSMAPRKKWAEDMQARFPKGTFTRIAAVLAPYEDRTDFVREAVERELQRREGESKKNQQPK